MFEEIWNTGTGWESFCLQWWWMGQFDTWGGSILKIWEISKHWARSGERWESASALKRFADGEEGLSRWSWLWPKSKGPRPARENHSLIISGLTLKVMVKQQQSAVWRLHLGCVTSGGPEAGWLVWGAGAFQNTAICCVSSAVALHTEKELRGCSRDNVEPAKPKCLVFYRKRLPNPGPASYLMWGRKEESCQQWLVKKHMEIIILGSDKCFGKYNMAASQLLRGVVTRLD